jgi:hypothetical protein
MKPLAVLATDRLTGRAAPLGLNRVPAASLDPARGGGNCGAVSQAFAGYDSQDVNCGPHQTRPTNLKPNIYHKAQDFTRGAYRAPGCRGASRADRHFKPIAWLVEDAACDC